MIKIVIVDDHKIVRDGIKSLLSKYPDVAVIAEMGSAREMLEQLPHLMPDVVLVDITMPEMNGLTALQKALELHPWLKFIVLTMHEEPEYVLEAIKKGANSYLLKNVEAEELLNAIRTVAGGGKYFNTTVSAILANSLVNGQDAKTKLPELSERETEVLREVASGLSTKMIAEKLGIGIRTVETHRAHAMDKLQASNTAELIKKAISLKLI